MRSKDVLFSALVFLISLSAKAQVIVTVDAQEFSDLSQTWSEPTHRLVIWKDELGGIDSVYRHHFASSGEVAQAYRFYHWTKISGHVDPHTYDQLPRNLEAYGFKGQMPTLIEVSKRFQSGLAPLNRDTVTVVNNLLTQISRVGYINGNAVDHLLLNWEYDSFGELICFTGLNRTNGDLDELCKLRIRDSLGRVVESESIRRSDTVSWKVDSITYEYDGIGHLKSALVFTFAGPTRKHLVVYDGWQSFEPEVKPFLEGPAVGGSGLAGFTKYEWDLKRDTLLIAQRGQYQYDENNRVESRTLSTYDQSVYLERMEYYQNGDLKKQSSLERSANDTVLYDLVYQNEYDPSGDLLSSVVTLVGGVKLRLTFTYQKLLPVEGKEREAKNRQTFPSFLNHTTRLRVFTILGTEVYNAEIDPGEVHLPRLSPGAYIVHLGGLKPIKLLVP